MTTRPLYKELAGKIQARLNRDKSGDQYWYLGHDDEIDTLVWESMPLGSGIDSGCDIDLDNSTGKKLVFNSSYHTMDENGFYGPWVDLTVTVKPSLVYDIEITITGGFSTVFDGGGLKDYLCDMFDAVLRQGAE